MKGIAFASINIPMNWITVINQNLHPLGMSQVRNPSFIITSVFYLERHRIHWSNHHCGSSPDEHLQLQAIRQVCWTFEDDNCDILGPQSWMLHLVGTSLLSSHSTFQSNNLHLVHRMHGVSQMHHCPLL